MGKTAQTILPLWRGFNLLEMFTSKSDGNFREEDFRWIADWGFDFLRLPMCYLLWIEGGDVFKVREEALGKIDQAVGWGEKYGIHVCLNFHRAPGYSVNREKEEPFNLWKDERALEAFRFHWELFAKRYKGIPSAKVSFDLVNEPTAPSEKGMTRADHERVMRAATEAIHKVDSDRLIIIDGVSWGNQACPELADLKIAQSCRAYAPMGVSHYRASWVGGENWPEPAWPGALHGNEPWDRARLEKHYEPWAELARRGVGVHCGEGGAFNQTPHDVFLGWFRDVLEILTGHGIGYALWNFRGSFGLLDSGRKDVGYEDWHGHKLDRRLLTLLQAY